LGAGCQQVQPVLLSAESTLRTGNSDSDASPRGLRDSSGWEFRLRSVWPGGVRSWVRLKCIPESPRSCTRAASAFVAV
jgi:hypothetical protein